MATLQGSLAEEKLGKQTTVTKKGKTVTELWVVFTSMWSWLDVDSVQAVNSTNGLEEPPCKTLT